MEKYLTPKDEKLLTYLFEHKAARVDQIHRDLFSNLSLRSVYYLINDLKKHKWIGAKGVFKKDRLVQVLHLYPKGFDLIGESLRYNFDDPVLKSDSPNHDLKLLDLVEWLKAFSMVDEIIPENILRSSSEISNDKILRVFKATRSDAYLSLKMNGLVADTAFEYEHSEKSLTRAKQKLEQYHKYKSINLVLYCVDSVSFIKKLWDLDRDICSNSRSKIYICHRKDDCFQNKNVIFKNCFGEEFSLS